ncbi:hypothetical protein AB8Z38_03100 [Bradyrhizobium sp. LLZ17]|uniref:Uncharacterized protein n=1 Tax=Bradyrhizobium sp. LLZ17 TaxID=3239388 RepID=A0AB39XMW4_9BRAD
MTRPAPHIVKAKLHEIDVRNASDRRKRDREPFSVAAARPNEIQRILADRYGRELPDDDAGRDDAFVMVNALAWRPNAQRRIPSWLSLWAPWMPADEVQALTAKLIAKPYRWGPDTIGKRLNLMDVDRTRLKITTIGGVDVGKAERLARRKQRARQREEQRRRANGSKTRAEYEAQSVSRSKPWEALGMSRARWYRLGKPAAETSPCAA